MYQLTSTSLYLCGRESAFRYSEYHNAFLWYERKSKDGRKSLFVNRVFPSQVLTQRHLIGKATHFTVLHNSNVMNTEMHIFNLIWSEITNVKLIIITVKYL